MTNGKPPASANTPAPAKTPTPSTPAQASAPALGRFKLVCNTQEEEDQVDLSQLRTGHMTGLLGSTLNIIKGALGGGILSGHSAYMYAGFVTGATLNISFGIFIGYCFFLIGKCSQIMSKRCKVPSMTYPDVAEAAVGLFPNPSIARLSLVYRHFLDFIVCLNLFGSCACYQLMVAKTIKQLIEDRLEQSMQGLNGMPHLRVYVAAMIIPTICICLITQLKFLSPFSLLGNLFVGLCCAMAIYYGISSNPTFSELKPFTNPYGIFQYTGMAVFSMSTAGICMPVENNMHEPQKFYLVMLIGYCFIISSVFLTSFFGYVGFRENCKSPITLNFPMELFPKILKACIAVMVYVTHAVNYFMPFNVVFYYIKQRIDQNRHFMWELICRAIGVTTIGIIAILFPNVDALIGFLGSFCVCNMAFICPNVIYLLIVWHRPGLGTMRWRLWRSIIFIIIGTFIFAAGTSVSFTELVKTLF